VLADARFDLGDLRGSLDAATRAYEAATQTGRELAEPLAQAAIARVRGARGEVEVARSMLDGSLALALERGRGGRYPRSIRAELELALGDWDAAWVSAEQALPGVVGLGQYVAEPVVDGIEALTALGRVEEARPLVDGLRRQAHAHGTPIALGPAERCVGVLALADGDVDGAVEALENALAHAERSPKPLDVGRTLIRLGEARRRRREKAAARETLRRAEALFDDVGHVLFAERAREERLRIGGRSTPAVELSATERRIAELVGTGRTNAEVAAALHLSRKTVEWNLSKIYRKLGVRSRAELAARRAQTPGTSRL